jgi:hypothetical protein
MNFNHSIMEILIVIDIIIIGIFLFNYDKNFGKLKVNFRLIGVNN